MMADDILSQLLPSLMGGGSSGSADPSEIGALKAYQGSPFLQGETSHSGPLGQISQALMPLISAKIYGQQAEQHQQMDKMKALLGVMTLAKELHGVDLQNAQNQAALEKMGIEKESHKHYIDMLDALNEGRGPKDAKVTVGDKGGSITFGGEKLPESEIGLIRAAQAGDSGAQDILTNLRQGRVGVASDEAKARSNLAVDEFKKKEEIKRDLPAKMSEKDRQIIHSGESLLGLLDEAPTAVSSIPGDVSRSQLALQAAKYQGGSEHPALSNIVTGLTGGMINTDTNPKLDQYFSWIGQVSSALASFNLEGQRGGFRTLQYLKDHFPGYQDSPERARDKVKWLVQNKGIIQQKIDAIHKDITKTAATATNLDSSGIAAEPSGSWMKVPFYNQKTKQQAFMWINPTTGETSAADPSGAGGD